MIPPIVSASPAITAFTLWLSAVCAAYTATPADQRDNFVANLNKMLPAASPDPE